ncbi:MAG: cytochrome b/b6 domain-containing protein [Syntrophobacteraceae bacterium]
MKYDRTTRWLHAGIVLTVAVQLISSALMEFPKPGRPSSNFGISFFRIHEWSGMTVFSLVALHWLWILSGHAAGGLVHLYPWFSKKRTRNVVSDLKSMPHLIHDGFSEQKSRGAALAGAVHGLGLLTVTGMALTGSIIFLGLGSDGSIKIFIRFVKECHEFIANFLWAYLFGHVGMAVLHQWQGDKVLTRMFNLIDK